MSWELYWRGDPDAVRAYRRAFEMIEKREHRKIWIQGLYNYEAIGDMVPVLRPFARAGTRPEPYPSEPHPFTAQEVREKREREEEQKAQEVRARLFAWMNGNNKRLQKKSEVMGNGE
jgi:hypothetical protein